MTTRYSKGNNHVRNVSRLLELCLANSASDPLDLILGCLNNEIPPNQGVSLVEFSGAESSDAFKGLPKTVQTEITEIVRQNLSGAEIEPSFVHTLFEVFQLTLLSLVKGNILLRSM